MTTSASSLKGTVVYSGVIDHVIEHIDESPFSITMGKAPNALVIGNRRERVMMWSDHGESFATVYDSSVPGRPVVGFNTGTSIDFSLDWLVGSMPEMGLAAHELVSGSYPGDFFDEENLFAAITIAAGDDALYGWVRMSHSLADEQLVIHDWAWNSAPGEPILAGEIPEPGTVALLAGIAALAAAGGRRTLRKRSMHTA